jgi:uncharacterized protein (TIGR00299 family) protein
MKSVEKTLYIDCFSGIAGDMFLGALFDVGAPRDVVEQELKKLSLEDWSLEVEPGSIDGISGVDVHVRIGGVTEFEHRHSPDDHHGRTYASIRDTLLASELKPAIKENALAVFECLAHAEGHVHGMAPEEVHFHEVGAVDAMIDIVGVCAAVDSLGVDRIVCAPLPMGRGFVECSHGRIPLPGPATLQILKGCPTKGVPIEGELVTPTGAALVKVLATEFGEYPEMNIEGIGYGLGDMRWPDRPNVVRLVLGMQETSSPSEVVLEANIDDMNPEWFSPLMGRLLEAGAKDVWLTSIQMKKGRPGVQISVMASQDKAEALTMLLTRESSTIGVRSHGVERFKLDRREESVDSRFGPIRVKTAWDGDERVNMAPEYEDCLAISHREGIALKDVYMEATRAFAQRDEDGKGESGGER